MLDRPSDNFQVAITDPYYFVGRAHIIEEVQQYPFRVRVLLGGRRLGKTSALRAIEWTLLDNEARSHRSRRAFPVFISLQLEQPEDLGNLRYLLIARLREATERWQKVPGGELRNRYRQFLRQVAEIEVGFSFFGQVSTRLNIQNPAKERRLDHEGFRFALQNIVKGLQGEDFEGVCFLLDEADFIISQKTWANDAWSYFRGLKDTDIALKSLFGLILSGYRDLKEYQQQVGSYLHHIAKVQWLSVLNEAEVKELVICRLADEGILLAEDEIANVFKWAGGHPYLTQQMLNAIWDNHREQGFHSWDGLMRSLLEQHQHLFSSWWNQNGQSDGFSEVERLVYRAIIDLGTGTEKSLAAQVHLGRQKVADALKVLAGTGVIRQLNNEEGVYILGAQLFKEWVLEQGVV